jgi:hypothetical protein
LTSRVIHPAQQQAASLAADLGGVVADHGEWQAQGVREFEVVEAGRRDARAGCANGADGAWCCGSADKRAFGGLPSPSSSAAARSAAPPSRKPEEADPLVGLDQPVGRSLVGNVAAASSQPDRTRSPFGR